LGGAHFTKTKKEENKESASSEASTVEEKRRRFSSKTNTTRFLNPQTVDRKWYLIDAKGKNLGRLCVEIAKILRGKRKASYTPNCDCGDFVIVTNAGHVTYTGKNKGSQTKYRRHTGYPGGLKTETLEQLLQRMPEKVIIKTVRGMLPKESTLAKAQLAKLKVYAGAEHPHAAQQPTIIEEIPLI
jgi:large subunit ribosomal protein L13